jgi:hypothetical protein
MDESTARNWDVGLKVVGFPGFAIGAAFSYFQYFDGVKRQETTALIATRHEQGFHSASRSGGRATVELDSMRRCRDLYSQFPLI